MRHSESQSRFRAALCLRTPAFLRPLGFLPRVPEEEAAGSVEFRLSGHRGHTTMLSNPKGPSAMQAPAHGRLGLTAGAQACRGGRGHSGARGASVQAGMGALGLRPFLSGVLLSALGWAASPQRPATQADLPLHSPGRERDAQLQAEGARPRQGTRNSQLWVVVRPLRAAEQGTDRAGGPSQSTATRARTQRQRAAPNVNSQLRAGQPGSALSPSSGRGAKPEGPRLLPVPFSKRHGPTSTPGHPTSQAGSGTPLCPDSSVLWACPGLGPSPDSSVLWACPGLGPSRPDSSVLWACPGLGPSPDSSVLWACPELGPSIPDSSVLWACPELGPSIPDSSVLWACPELGPSPDSSVLWACPELGPSPDSSVLWACPGLGPSPDSSVLWACPGLGPSIPDSSVLWACPGLGPSIPDSSVLWACPELGPSPDSSVLWACPELGPSPDSSVLWACPELGPSPDSSVLWACPELGPSPDSSVLWACPGLGPSIPDSSVLWACPGLGPSRPDSSVLWACPELGPSPDSSVLWACPGLGPSPDSSVLWACPGLGPSPDSSVLWACPGLGPSIPDSSVLWACPGLGPSRPDSSVLWACPGLSLSPDSSVLWACPGLGPSGPRGRPGRRLGPEVSGAGLCLGAARVHTAASLAQAPCRGEVREERRQLVPAHPNPRPGPRAGSAGQGEAARSLLVTQLLSPHCPPGPPEASGGQQARARPPLCPSWPGLQPAPAGGRRTERRWGGDAVQLSGVQGGPHVTPTGEQDDPGTPVPTGPRGDRTPSPLLCSAGPEPLQGSGGQGRSDLVPTLGQQEASADPGEYGLLRDLGCQTPALAGSPRRAGNRGLGELQRELTAAQGLGLNTRPSQSKAAGSGLREAGPGISHLPQEGALRTLGKVPGAGEAQRCRWRAGLGTPVHLLRPPSAPHRHCKDPPLQQCGSHAPRRPGCPGPPPSQDQGSPLPPGFQSPRAPGALGSRAVAAPQCLQAGVLSPRPARGTDATEPPWTRRAGPGQAGHPAVPSGAVVSNGPRLPTRAPESRGAPATPSSLTSDESAGTDGRTDGRTAADARQGRPSQAWRGTPDALASMPTPPHSAPLLLGARGPCSSKRGALTLRPSPRPEGGRPLPTSSFLPSLRSACAAPAGASTGGDGAKAKSCPRQHRGPPPGGSENRSHTSQPSRCLPRGAPRTQGGKVGQRGATLAARRSPGCCPWC
ncbi:collagen alpha-1(III) chain-like [Perognathus longimembris pacificus]|uniref:collagen alpha-1(III) chain-like n=1 Tax=Perognathus longimembris pacificus TaxID=214514 RepID=UPI00201956A1|nr:collagen alpha-1(III) chain-like [Perognathus longimembris pacificus]